MKRRSDFGQSRSIVITGCSSGIGALAAYKLRDRGYHVIPTCRRSEDQLRLQNAGFSQAILLDLNNPSSVEHAANHILSFASDSLYALFNNAGFGIYGSIASLSREQLEAQFATNFFGVHQLTRHLLPALIAQGDARIIQTSSIVGVVATPGRAAYTASKFALEGWSDTLRLELASTGVKVSLIEPGPIQTAFKENVQQLDVEKRVENPPIAKRFTLPPEAILPALYHALEHRSPKTRYRISKVTQLAALGKRILPDKWLDRFLR